MVSPSVKGSQYHCFFVEVVRENHLFFTQDQTSFTVKTTTQSIRKLKGRRPIVAVTAYDFPTATFADRGGVDLILVGDSVGTTQLGFESTVPVTLEMILHHTAAVTRAHPSALVVADLPFGLAQRDADPMFEVCCRLIQETGCDAIKIEGGVKLSAKIQRLVTAGIPVLGHVGLLPQSVKVYGGYRRFGKNAGEASSIVEDALALEESGVFAVVAEMLDPLTTARLQQELKIPVIGIGSGTDCDGQILVCNDLLGTNPGKTPSFAKAYGEIGQAMTDAFKAYAEEVREGLFPSRK